MPNKAQIIFINYQEPVINFDMSRVLRKPVFGVSDQVHHKAVVTEDDQRLEIMDLGSRGIVLSI